MRTVLSSMIWLVLAPCLVHAQGTAADYQHAEEARQKYQGLATGIPGAVTWIDAERFWYRRSVKGGNEFVLVDARSQSKTPAFDHEKLAASVSAAAGQKYSPITLPFTAIEFADGGRAIEFAAAGAEWKCQLSDYACTKTGPIRAAPGRGGQGPDPGGPDDAAGEFHNDVADGMVVSSPEYLSPQQGAGRGAGGAAAGQDAVRASPDGNWEAFIRNFNVFLRATGAGGATPLSLDGSEGNYYTFQSITWSPDSKHLVAYRVRPGYRREVHYVESSPADQVQPKHSTRVYAKPGDAVDVARPMLFQIAQKKEIEIDDSLFPNP